MRTRLKTYLLLAASILMLAVAVYPHHHHHDKLCLKTNTEACLPPLCGCEDSHNACKGDSHECNSACVTHFSFSSQDNHPDVSPDFTFYSLIYSVRSITDCVFFLFPGDEHRSAYIERLHARRYARTGSLRAPPVALRTFA